MSDEPKTEAAAEAEATRRRWINLAEIVAVAGLLISGLALWNSYRERTVEESDKASARVEAQTRERTVILRATADRRGERLALAPVDPEQTVQSLRIVFPMALAIAPVETLADPRIEAAWFRREILLTAEREVNEARLPVAITTHFYRDGTLSTHTAIYYVIYRIEGGGLLDGRELRLHGLSRLPTREMSEGEARRVVDDLWRARSPSR